MLQIKVITHRAFGEPALALLIAVGPTPRRSGSSSMIPENFIKNKSWFEITKKLKNIKIIASNV